MDGSSHREAAIEAALGSPTPSEEWLERWDTLMLDDWLRRKLDRERRVREHVEYLDRWCPEFWTFEGSGAVTDLGCADGVLLDLAREMGYEVMGVDACSGEGGMGDDYLRGHSVFEAGAQHFFKTCPAAGDGLLVNSRGSLEQMFADYMEGPPHHLHHDCKRLWWRLSDYRLLDQALGRMFRWVAAELKPGGVMLIHANGSANHDEFAPLLLGAAERELLELADHNDRLFKWRRTGGPEQ